MYNHAPQNYECPLCLAVNGIENDKTMVKQDDIFYRDDLVMALINSKFVGNNPGHVIVIPLVHYENIYDIPKDTAHRIFDVAQKISIALKEVRKCDGVTTMQNNEPAGDQHAFHFHFHIFPRFENDNLHENMSKNRVSSSEERSVYSSSLKQYFKDGRT